MAIALVTGGVGGIGSAICKALHDNGHKVALTYHSNLNHVLEPGIFSMYQCDVSDFNSCSQVVQEIKQDLGLITILVNCAGITRDATLKNMTIESWNDVINTNLGSVFNMSKNVLPHMLEANFGRIINISSINGQKGQFGQTNYSASKAGIHGFTMALAQEVAKKGITVNTIAPGYIATDMVMNVPEDIRKQIIANIPVGRLGNPQEIAQLVMYLSSELSGFITGSEIAINGGQHMM